MKYYWLFILFALVGVGCSSSRHSIQSFSQRIDTMYVRTTHDSIVYKYDTVYIERVVKYVEQAENTTEALTSEWWDNITRTWIDSLGREITEKYEKGNRQSSVKDQSTYIRQLEDSLSYYKGSAYHYEESFNRLFDQYISEMDSVTAKETVVKTKGLNKIQIVFFMLVGFMLGFGIVWLYIKLKATWRS